MGEASGARLWITLGAVWAALGVALGALGAHALRERLDVAGQLDNWHTAAHYQMLHALALIAYGLFERGRQDAGGRLVGWTLLLGSLFFSGSIYLLALDVASSLVWPLTPLGGLLMIVGWIAFALRAVRGARSGRG